MARLERLHAVEHHGHEWWVVDGIFSGLSLLWGEPGAGKSFVAISVAASVASGRPWLGRHTRQGRVVYIAGEGGSEAVARRMRTALDVWGVDPEDEQTPIDIVTPGVDLTKGPSEIMGLMAAGEPPVLIVIDTLSRCFVGDENKQEPMGGFVRSLDLMRDAYPLSCMLVIHHSNKQDEVRGSTVLLGAVDTSWKLTKLPNITGVHGLVREIVPQKLRERDVEGAIHRFLLRPTRCRDRNGTVETDSFGDVQSSLIIKPHPDDTRRARTVMNSGLALIAQHGQASYLDWRGYMGKAEFDAALSYILTYPGDWGGIVQCEPGIFVLDTGDRTGVP